MCTKEQNGRDHFVVDGLIIGLHAFSQHSNNTAIVFKRLRPEPITPELIVRRHLSNTQGGGFEQTAVVVIVEVGEEAEMAREAVAIVLRYEAMGKVGEGDLLVRDSRITDNGTTAGFAHGDTLFVDCFLAAFSLGRRSPGLLQQGRDLAYA